MTQYMCPVCGFLMEEPPCDYNICASCGTEFGLHDVNMTVDELRADWLRNGAKWWSNFQNAPAGWDPYVQVSKLLRPPPIARLKPANEAFVIPERLKALVAGTGQDSSIRRSSIDAKECDMAGLRLSNQPIVSPRGAIQKATRFKTNLVPAA